MSKPYVDPRLAALYNEYVKKDKEFDFLFMLYVVLHYAKQDIRKKAQHAFATWLRKQNAPKRKSDKEKWDSFIGSMSTDELIKFQNTPYEDLPDWIKELNPKIVQRPERNNFARIYGLVGLGSRQKEITASRITRYMERAGFKKTNNDGLRVLDYDLFSDVINRVAPMFDQSWKNGLMGQHTRVSARDLKNYVENRVRPKEDKLAMITVVTDLPLWYMAGYASPNTPPPTDGRPLTPYHK